MACDLCFQSPTKGKQSSFVTVFSIWNTMVGSTLLTLPWAVAQAGFVLAIVLLALMAALNLYTSYRIIKSAESMKCPISGVTEFSDICKKYLGRCGEIITIFSSSILMVGILLVYWVIMANTLYSIVCFIYNTFEGTAHETGSSNSSYGDKYILCMMEDFSPEEESSELTVSRRVINSSNSTDDQLFHNYWDVNKTVPFFLLFLLVPIINFKSSSFFTKFTAFGNISAFYLLGFVTYKLSIWGLHMDFDEVPGHYFRWSFPVITGVGAMALHIQVPILSIVRQQKNPQNNVRDLTIAYICVTLTYTYVGCAFYAGWPMISKDCIDQMITLYPLTMYIMRIQLLNTFFGSIWPSWKHVVALNLIVIVVCLMFARFFAQIGTILRYTGSFCGQNYGFILPALIYLLAEKKKDQLTIVKTSMHVLLVVLVLTNFIAQFFMPW
ncbi:neutral amino acid transporter 9-like isoform X2 [Watersipora subatra]|uniref:neutral amino acid transporter 9-like isoform X2 n=1 Tax=Watersipora subatra TaxID=2589382 RepID=UPI00355C7C34